MLSDVLLGIIKKYRQLETPQKKSEFVSNLRKLTLSSNLSLPVSENDLEEILSQEDIQSLIKKMVS